MFRHLTKQVISLFAQSWRPPTRTQVFHSLSNKQLATPELVKAILKQPIPYHSRTSQVSLYHKKRVRHAVTSSFSQHKNKRFKRIHKIKNKYFSQILNQKIRITCSNKAYRTIKKYGSFDNYILLTRPKDLDSKFGEYLRTLMLRKINDPEYRIPYILRTKPRPIIKKYRRFIQLQKDAKYIIPKQFKKNFVTLQRKFGSIVDQLNEQDYSKYVQLEKLKKTVGNQIDPEHPLALELDKKLQNRFTPQQQARMAEMSQQFKNQYINHPKNTQKRRAKFQKNQKQAQELQFKLRQAFIKFQSIGGSKID